MSTGTIDFLDCNGYAVNMGYLYNGVVLTISTDADISGRVFHLKIKETSSASSYLLELTNATGTYSGLHVDTTAKTVEIRINSADSDGLTTAGRKPYELHYVEAGEKVMICEGKIEFINGALL